MISSGLPRYWFPDSCSICDKLMPLVNTLLAQGQPGLAFLLLIFTYDQASLGTLASSSIMIIRMTPRPRVPATKLRRRIQVRPIRMQTLKMLPRVNQTTFKRFVQLYCCGLSSRSLIHHAPGTARSPAVAFITFARIAFLRIFNIFISTCRRQLL